MSERAAAWEEFGKGWALRRNGFFAYVRPDDETGQWEERVNRGMTVDMPLGTSLHDTAEEARAAAMRKLKQLESGDDKARPTVVIDREAAREMMQELKRLVENVRGKESETGRSLFSQQDERPQGIVPAIVKQMSALAFLFDLPDELLSFVAACAQDPTDHVTLQVFADWLEEKQRPAEAKAVRRLTPQSGDVLVMTYPRGGHEEVEREALMRAGQQLRKHLAGLGRDVFVAVMPEGYDLRALERKQLEALGLARATVPIGGMETPLEAAERLCKENTMLRKEVERLKRRASITSEDDLWYEQQRNARAPAGGSAYEEALASEAVEKSLTNSHGEVKTPGMALSPDGRLMVPNGDNGWKFAGDAYEEAIQ